LRLWSSVSVLFSEPKIPQSVLRALLMIVLAGFSALQRAENSSMIQRQQQRRAEALFQCSSASRKFLNAGFSRTSTRSPDVSVLFSEPKIPQSG